MRKKLIIYAHLVLLANFCKVSGYAAEGDKSPVVAVTASVVGGGVPLAAALAELAAQTLRAEGVPARATAPPLACTLPHAADAQSCRNAVFSRIAHQKLHVALLAVPAARPPAAEWQLRDAGVYEIGDVAPPAHRVCVAPPPARSLLDLTDASLANNYYVSPDYLQILLTNDLGHGLRLNNTYTPEWCVTNLSACATLLTSDEGEKHILESVIRTHRLYATVYNLGASLNAITATLDSRFIVCDWGMQREGVSSLGPPPCDFDNDENECPFESRRLVKLVNARELARWNRAIQALVRLRLTAVEVRNLTKLLRESKPEETVARFLAAHPTRTSIREVRVAVMLPNSTHREAYDAAALAAAATLAEADLKNEWSGSIRFKVETYDDHCDATRAYQYLNDALNSREYGSLSAVAGPACGVAFADVARTAPSPVHTLPAIAYTPQAPPTTPNAALALLAAGDARVQASALGALLTRFGWRRLAALSETATRASLAAARLQADLVAHFELPDDKQDYDQEIFTQWAERVAYAKGRIIYLCVEDGRAARGALCAGHAAGLTPAAGAVWLLPATLPFNALAPHPEDACEPHHLSEMLDGHISVALNWTLPWLHNITGTKGKNNSSETSKEIDSDKNVYSWRMRWRTQCKFLGMRCGEPSPHAVLLYDALRLWARALAALAHTQPAALDDLHDIALVRSLVSNATRNDFTGMTGRFEWAAVGMEGNESAAYARSSPLVFLQWNGLERREIGHWYQDRLELYSDVLRWRTTDGNVPDDGGEQCALQSLADFFHSECRTAFVILGVLILSLAIFLLVIIAIYCKRRAERNYRARLEEMGLHALLPKTIGLDHWEIPRERVVINRKLGMGAFGTVYGGYALIAEDRGWTAVAVKTLKAGASTEEKLDFLSEAEAMKRFDHKNVVRLLAVVTKTEPVCTVMEFMLYGDLKNYLLARRHLACAAEDVEEQVSARRLTGMALDAARALSYLAQLRYVHRDVAARNCLVSARRVVKLADFGMTRLVYENDYYRFSRKGMLPVRWMAPESLALGVFSPASDVWSFGVLLYEIVTFGSLPFQGLSNSEVLARVKGGQILELPPGLKPQLEGLIKSCWKTDAKARPAASEVAAFLADWPRLLAPCLDVPLDVLPLDNEPPWRLTRWGWPTPPAPPSQATDTTYLSDAPLQSAPDCA